MKEAKTFNWLDSLTKSDRRVRWILILGAVGILLIVASGFLPSQGQEEESQQDAQAVQEISSDDYVKAMEDRLYDLVTSIEGVGRAKVMVTLESSGETVYATEGKSNSNLVQGEAGASQKVTESTEESYILVEGKDGAKQALVSKQLEPPIKGVVIVCQGAQDPVVQERVLQSVTTALGISSSKVCITQISS